VVIHPLTDNRRMLPLDRKGELVAARPDFLLVVSYNPGYQSAVKDLKESTKQRFVAIDFTYPAHAAEASIVAREAAIDARTAAALVGVAASTRNLRGRGLNEGASTRMIVYAGRLIAAGISTNEALRASVVLPLTDDPDTREALETVIAACTARARPASSPATPRSRTSTWCIGWCAIGRRYGPAWRGATRRLLTSGPARPWSCRRSMRSRPALRRSGRLALRPGRNGCGWSRPMSTPPPMSTASPGRGPRSPAWRRCRRPFG